MEAPRPGDAAPPGVPIAALTIGAAALTAGALALVARPVLLLGYHGAPAMVALTHVFTLGFVGLVFAGTLQQFPAVLLVARLTWPRLGYVALPLLALGSAAVVAGFAMGFAPVPLALGGAAVAAAWSALLAQLAATARGSRHLDAAGRALIVSVGYMTLTAVLGVALAAARSVPSVPRAIGYPVGTHFTTGLFGAYLLGIAAAGQKLLSMFALSKGGVRWRLRALTWAVHLAVAAEVATRFAGLPLAALAWSAIAAAAALHLWEVAAIVRRRLRRRLEAPIRRYLLAHAFLPVAGALWLAGEAPAAALAFALGFVGLAVSGMLVKIVSFLSWTAGFAADAASRGAAAAPLLRDLVLPTLEPVITWGLALGALAATLAVATGWAPAARMAAPALGVGAVAQLAQVVHVILAVRRAARPQEVLV